VKGKISILIAVYNFSALMFIKGLQILNM